MRTVSAVGVACLMAGLGGCGGGQSPMGTAATYPWLQVNDFLYQLQDLNLAAVGQSKFDLVIMDYSRTGDASGEWSSGQLRNLKLSAGGSKILLAYMSIGEAEDYRFYWRPAWQPGSPAFLLGENPDWPGNYRVRYWSPGWQQVIFGSPGSYLDKIMAQGFDGVYLDIVDAYEGFPARPTARQDMISFVRAISAYAKARRPAFRIVPQNASDLVNDPLYLAAIDGLGQEELSFGWDGADGVATPPAIRTALMANLDKVVAARKLVLVTDYCRVTAKVNEAYARAAAHGYVDYCTVRDLNRLIINPGHEPD